MAIRFCKGREEEFDKEKAIRFDENVFENAHNLFLNTKLEYIALVDDDNNYICCCYDDKNIDNLFNKIYLLFHNKHGLKRILKKYRKCTIVSLNEISYYLYKFLKENNCDVTVYGDLWKYLNIDTNDKFRNSSIYSEGNIGLDLSELGYYKTTFPFNEFSFFEKLYDKVLEKNKLYDKKILSKKKANDLISKKIRSGEPFMAARLGNTEAIISNQYSTYYTKFWLKYLYTISGFYSMKDYSEDIEDIFDKDDVDRYVDLTIDGIKNCDFYMCCVKNDSALINNNNKNSYNIDWYDLYTDFDNNSWINALTNKKVLVISSFNETIKHQLKNKDKLFSNFKYPDLNIKYYDFPTTFIGNYDKNVSFFENYDKILSKIKKIDFDIALIAAGAYGYLLANDIKKMGKQSIELCSGLYPVFGVKNKTQAIIRRVSSMYNKFWIFPIEDKPANYMKVEKGSYWE